MKSVYNRLGGLQLDKDFRSLSSYLTGIAGWIVREKCTRLSQVSLNYILGYRIRLDLVEFCPASIGLLFRSFAILDHSTFKSELQYSLRLYAPIF